MVKHTWRMQRIALTSGEQLYTEEYLTGGKKSLLFGKNILDLVYLYLSS